MDPLAADVLAFWFGPQPHAVRDCWFRKDPGFDADVARRYGVAIGEALRGGLAGWESSPRGTLARILLLDQFTRNVHRDTAAAFAGDAEALRAAVRLVDAGADATLDPYERWFAYLPFEHAESIAMQDRSIALFTRLRDETGLADPLAWAQRHAAVIARFGRYPHRNAPLGRSSTEEEIAFLAMPGSRF
jgi:uncharacterized protein (DUF924 family)